MGMSDWSADWCSSDLVCRRVRALGDALSGAAPAGTGAAFRRLCASGARRRMGTRGRRCGWWRGRRMTESLPAGIDPNLVQRAAAAPDRSVWVTASAGSGKTKVLTDRSEEHTSELQSLMRISYAVFCLKK